MTATMVQSVVVAVLILVFDGAQGLEPEERDFLAADVMELPWRDELCCESPLAHFIAEGNSMHAPETNRSESNLPHRSHCHFRSLTTESDSERPSSGTCVVIQCGIDENWENVTCELQARGPTSADPLDTSIMEISLQRLHREDDSEDYNLVVCKAVHMCSVPLDATTSFITMVTISVSDAVAPQVLLGVPARHERPSPPTNLSHIQTIEPELILKWDDPFNVGPLTYEVRYAPKGTPPDRQVQTSTQELELPLDLKPSVNYTIQVRSGLYKPLLWSKWSQPHYIYLETVSYIPETASAKPGENVTVYCVFNDRSANASTAAWKLNFESLFDPSQYHAVNQRVSRLTMRPSGTAMYEILRCPPNWSTPYSQIYVLGAFVNISCVTSGDIDSMTCSWKNTQQGKLQFKCSWADLPCDEMEGKGNDTGKAGGACPSLQCKETSCTIQPLRMNCYKLWMEYNDAWSKPVYLSPMDHVKPHAPTDLKAVSQSSGVLGVTWEPPSLPVEGLQCQLRYASPSTVRPKPEWKDLPPVTIPRAEVEVPDMCGIYMVQARCQHISGTGYWSDWTDSVYSTPGNSRAPERGPDFWRILQDDPHRKQTNVTLLFKQLPVSDRSYCVDGFKVQYQTSAGVMEPTQMEALSSYSFAWNQEPLTVTVEAYNSVGSSVDNIRMTLNSQPKRPCVHSFHVSVINSTCVSLSWSLLDNSSVPLFMVVQWLPQRQQDADLHKGHDGDAWARLPYTDSPVYLRGHFFSSENLGFYLHPVFADGEGEAVFAIATRAEPAAYVLLVIISFLSVVLLVTLVLSQKKMKKFVWKDVPNPKKCSWAKGLDLKKGDTFDPLFRTAEGLGVQAWQPLLPSESISQVFIVDNADVSALTSALIETPLASPSSDKSTGSCLYDSVMVGNELLPVGTPSSAVTLASLSGSHPRIDELLPVDLLPDRLPVTTDSSAQSSVTYSTVLHSNPKQTDTGPLHYKDGSRGGSSCSDEGNFSANNSDISGSFPGGLWELDTCRGGDMEDPRRSCSYNSVEELSETSEQQDEGDVKEEKHLFYLGTDYSAEDEDEEEQREEEPKTGLLKDVVLNREDCCSGSNHLLGPDDSGEPSEVLSASTCGFSPPYLPQFRTATCTMQPHDGKPHL